MLLCVPALSLLAHHPAREGADSLRRGKGGDAQMQRPRGWPDFKLWGEKKGRPHPVLLPSVVKAMTFPWDSVLVTFLLLHQNTRHKKL